MYIGTNTWSSHSGSAGNLKSSIGDISREKEETIVPLEVTTRREERECDGESGSEETIVASQVSLTTVSSHTHLRTNPPPPLSNEHSLATPPITTLTPPDIASAGDSTLINYSPLHKGSLPPSGLIPAPSRRPKVGSSVQTSRVTASSNSSLHRRQASMGGATPTTPSPLMGSHKRHSSVRLVTLKWVCL